MEILVEEEEDIIEIPESEEQIISENSVKGNKINVVNYVMIGLLIILIIFSVTAILYRIFKNK